MENQPNKFDFLLSIGTACKTRYQIERYLKNTIPDYEYPSCFFDWLISGSIICFQKTIIRDFKLNANEFICNSFAREDNFVPLHEPTGLRFYHELGSIDEVRKNCATANLEMQKNMPEFLEKINYIGNRRNRILASRYNIGLVFYGPLENNQKENTLSLLNEKYAKNFSIIHVNKSIQQEELDAEHLNFRIDEKAIIDANNEWKGLDQKWDKVFDQISLNKHNLKDINEQIAK